METAAEFLKEVELKQQQPICSWENKKRIQVADNLGIFNLVQNEGKGQQKPSELSS